MKLFTAILSVALVCHVTAAISSAEEKKARRVAAPLGFDPGAGPWKGEAPTKGASWHNLQRGPIGKSPMMQARAGIGDKFPVSEAPDRQLFEVLVENGLNDHLVVLVLSEEPPQRVKLLRGKAVPVTVAGTKYTLTFPRVRVEAEAGEKPVSNKAPIMVMRPE